MVKISAASFYVCNIISHFGHEGGNKVCFYPQLRGRGEFPKKDQFEMQKDIWIAQMQIGPQQISTDNT